MHVHTWKNSSLVNTTEPGFQQDPDVVALPDGGYVIVWMDDGNIIGRSYNADGTPRTGEFLLADEIDPAVNPDVAVHADGTIFLTYNISIDNGPDTNRIVAFNSNGAVLDTLTTTALATDSDDPDIVVSGNDVHVGLGRTISTSEEAYQLTQTWNGTNLAFVRASRANNTLTDDQQDVDLAVLTNGNTVAVWRDGNRVEFEILDTGGNRVIGVDILVADTGNQFNNPEVMALANGGFVVTYARTNGSFPAQGYDTYFRVFAPNGVSYGFEVLVNSSGTSSDQFYPVATPLNDGGFAVFWFDSDGVNKIRGQLYDGVGNPRGGPFIAANGVATNYDAFDVDTLSDGRMVLTYEILDPSTAANIVTTILDPREGLVEGSDGDDTLYGSNFADEVQGLNGNDLVLGMGGTDLLLGYAGGDVLNGGGGDDTLLGGGGNDTLIGGAGADEMDGQGGIDTVSYSGSAMRVIARLDGGANSAGAAGDVFTSIENLIGTSFDDRLVGNSGANRIVGLDGNDELFGMGGNDVLIGGEGADTLNGQGGIDTVSYAGSAMRVTARLDGGANGAGATGDVLTSIENLIGTSFDDLLVGNSGANRIVGLDDDDVLFGLGGNDVLIGGEGNDELNGQGGDDVLIGDAGDDTLEGHGGNDRFVFADGFGTDTIVDFGATRNLEKIDLSAVTSIIDWADLTNPLMPQMTQVGADVVIDDFAGNTITLQGVNLADLHEIDFVF